ncbi:MAG: hypothetical protein RL223_1518 [Pseudomonadota bacterium]
MPLRTDSPTARPLLRRLALLLAGLCALGSGLVLPENAEAAPASTAKPKKSAKPATGRQAVATPRRAGSRAGAREARPSTTRGRDARRAAAAVPALSAAEAERQNAALAARTESRLTEERKAAEAAALRPDAPCGVRWQLHLGQGGAPARLSLHMATEAGVPLQLRLPVGWQALQALPDDEGQTPAWQEVAGDPSLRRLTSGSTGIATWRWTLRPEQTGPALRLGEGWYAALGQALLPAPVSADDEPRLQLLCVEVQGAAEGSPHMSSHGRAQGSRAQWRFVGTPQLAQRGLYAGGALRGLTRSVDGHGVRLLWPAELDEGGAPAAEAPAPGAGESGTDPALPTAREALAERVLREMHHQRQFWRDEGPATQDVLLLPAPRGLAPEALAFDRALMLRLQPGPTAPDTRLDASLTEALLRQRLPDRLGPAVHHGRQDEAMRAWLSEGLIAYYRHRLPLISGQQTLQDYADTLNARIARYLALPVIKADNVSVATGWMMDPALAELPALRGEFLALQWQAELRARRHPGLDALLRPLMLPPEQVRHEGLSSQPLASHRVVAALRRALDDSPLDGIERHIDRGQPFSFGPQALGPCFSQSLQPRPVWRLGFDRASLTLGVIRGLEPDGPAALAGVRDGMAVRGYLVAWGDVEQAVLLQVQEGSALRTLSWRPAGTRTVSVPVYRPQADALQATACKAWLGLAREEPAAEAHTADESPAAAAPATRCRSVKVVEKTRGANGRLVRKTVTRQDCQAVATRSGGGSAKATARSAAKSTKSTKSTKSAKADKAARTAKATKVTKADKTAKPRKPARTAAR